LGAQKVLSGEDRGAENLGSFSPASFRWQPAPDASEKHVGNSTAGTWGIICPSLLARKISC